jgi:hypothetical protein
MEHLLELLVPDLLLKEKIRAHYIGRFLLISLVVIDINAVYILLWWVVLRLKLSTHFKV